MFEVGKSRGCTHKDQSESQFARNERELYFLEAQEEFPPIREQISECS